MSLRVGDRRTLSRALLVVVSASACLLGGAAWTALWGEGSAARLGPAGAVQGARRPGRTRAGPSPLARGGGIAAEVPGGDRDFGKSVLQSLDAHIAVLDRRGVIVAVNTAWNQFALRNGGNLARCGVGVDYLDGERSGGLSRGPRIGLGLTETMDRPELRSHAADPGPISSSRPASRSAAGAWRGTSCVATRRRGPRRTEAGRGGAPHLGLLPFAVPDPPRTL